MRIAQRTVKSVLSMTEFVFVSLTRDEESRDCLTQLGVFDELKMCHSRPSEDMAAWREEILSSDSLMGVPEHQRESICAIQAAERLVVDCEKPIRTQGCEHIEIIQNSQFQLELLKALCELQRMRILIPSESVSVQPVAFRMELSLRSLYLETALAVVQLSRLRNTGESATGAITRLLAALRSIHTHMQSKLTESPRFWQVAVELALSIDLGMGVMIETIQNVLHRNKIHATLTGMQAQWKQMTVNLERLSTVTTTTAAPATLSIDELELLFAQPDKPPTQSKKGKAKNKPPKSKVKKVDTDTTTTTTESFSTTTPDTDTIDHSGTDWEIVDRSKPRAVKTEKIVTKPTRNAVRVEQRSETPGLTETAQISTTTDSPFYTVTTAVINSERATRNEISGCDGRTFTTSHPPLGTEPTSIVTTATIVLNDKTEEAMELPSDEFILISTVSSGKAETTTTTRELQLPGPVSVKQAEKPRKVTRHQTCVNHHLPTQIGVMAYFGVPLARPAIDEICRMSGEMGKLVFQIAHMKQIAQQQVCEPSILANIEQLSEKLAQAENSIIELQLAARGLSDLMNTFHPLVFVPGHPN